MDIVEIQRAGPGSQRADVNAKKRLTSCRVTCHDHVVEMLRGQIHRGKMLHDWIKASVLARRFFKIIIAHLRNMHVESLLSNNFSLLTLLSS